MFLNPASIIENKKSLIRVFLATHYVLGNLWWPEVENTTASLSFGTERNMPISAIWSQVERKTDSPCIQSKLKEKSNKNKKMY